MFYGDWVELIIFRFKIHEILFEFMVIRPSTLKVSSEVNAPNLNAPNESLFSSAHKEIKQKSKQVPTQLK